MGKWLGHPGGTPSTPAPARPGVITTEAGNGNSTFAGDGGAATAAGVMSPTSVGVDAANNLYIGDGSMRVRAVTL